jgi:uncharacterized protein YndB with AHSA1/START domain
MTTADALPVTRELTLTRVFDAPRELVFRMWTDPVHLAQWWGPKGFTAPVCEVDARPGGALRIHMRAPDGEIYQMKGEFREVVPPEKLVFTNISVDADDNHVIEGLTTVTLVAHGARTEMTLHTTAVAIAPYAAAYLSGMDAGWGQSVDKLAERLAAV